MLFRSVHSWYNAASGTAGGTVTFTQALTLDASGNLGLGVTSISAIGSSRLLEIGATTGNSSFLLFNVNGVRTGAVYSNTSETSVGSISSVPLLLKTGDTERARITSGGNFLIGATDANDSSTGFKYDNTRDGAGHPRLVLSDSGTTDSYAPLGVYSTGASAYRFYVGMAGTVFATNTTISAISDQRFKENIQDLDIGLDKIMALKPRKFDWKAGKGKDIKGDRGFIAQEFEQVFPDLIDEWKDPAPEGEEPYKSVRQDLIPVLVKAIQELNAKVQALEAQLKGA